MKPRYYKWLAFFLTLAAALAWQGCQEEEDFVRRTEVSRVYKNVYANLLFKQMEGKEEAYQALQDALGGHEAAYEHLKILTHSHYGVCYFIPFTDAGSTKVTGAVYYPVDATISDDNIVHFSGDFGTPEAYDANRINNKVGILEGRFLYSAEFLLLEEEGVEVDPALSEWAHFLNNRFIPVDPSEFPDVEMIPTRASGTKYKVFLGTSYSYIGYDYTDDEGDALVHGLSREGITYVVERTFRQMHMEVRAYVDTRTIIFEISDDILPSQYNFETFLSEFISIFKMNILLMDFSVSIYQRCDVIGRTIPGGTGSGTGGSTGGGSSSGGDRSPKEPTVDNSDIMKEIHQQISEMFMRFDSAQTVTIGSKNYISFQTYLNDIGQDPTIEHATTLIFHPEEEGDRRYLLTPTEYGVANRVNNTIISINTIAEIHNHPDASPPSAQDLFFTVDEALYSNNYQATFVYDYASGDYYSIYVANNRSVQGLYDILKNEVDPETHDFVEDGKCNEFLEGQKNLYKRFSTEEQRIYRLGMVIAEYGANMALTKYKASTKKTTVYRVKVTESNGKKSYQPVKYEK